MRPDAGQVGVSFGDDRERAPMNLIAQLGGQFSRALGNNQRDNRRIVVKEEWGPSKPRGDYMGGRTQAAFVFTVSQARQRDGGR